MPAVSSGLCLHLDLPISMANCSWRYLTLKPLCYCGSSSAKAQTTPHLSRKLCRAFPLGVDKVILSKDRIIVCTNARSKKQGEKKYAALYHRINEDAGTEKKQNNPLSLVSIKPPQYLYFVKEICLYWQITLGILWFKVKDRSDCWGQGAEEASKSMRQNQGKEEQISS